MPSPTTPQPAPSYDRSGDYDLPNGFSNEVEPDNANGLGNLADELAEAFDEDADEVIAGELREAWYNGTEDETNGYPRKENHGTTSSLPQPSRERSLSPPKQPTRSKHHPRQTSQYDGSDYGDDSDLERTDGISLALEARMAAIEGLARRGTGLNGSDLDKVVYRVVDHLKDLGSQSNIENGASRLITTHTALTSHLSNQSRTISTLIHPLTSPLSAPPAPGLIEDIVPLLTSLVTNLPIPTSQPLSSLHSLQSSTADLANLLSSLSDTLYMTRQTTSLAARRLRTATELVVEMRRDVEASEEAVRWLEKGRWDERLAERECARVCGDVIGGFEETCNTWRERLLGGLEVGAGSVFDWDGNWVGWSRSCA